MSFLLVPDRLNAPESSRVNPVRSVNIRVITVPVWEMASSPWTLTSRPRGHSVDFFEKCVRSVDSGVFKKPHYPNATAFFVVPTPPRASPHEISGRVVYELYALR